MNRSAHEIPPALADPATGSRASTAPRGDRASPAHDAFRARSFFGSLDGWRCLSVLAVVWHHCHGSLRFGVVGEQGFLGVAMFFVISGFLIMTLLLRERERDGDISLRAFYVRRTLRIMPLYYGIVFVTAFGSIVFFPDGATAQQMKAGLPYLLTYTTNWVFVGTFLAISWSLSAEEQFYLVSPAVQKYVPRASGSSSRCWRRSCCSTSAPSSGCCVSPERGPAIS